MVFVHDIERKQGQMSKVFVASANDKGVESVVYANSGRMQEQDNGESDLILKQGQRYYVKDELELQRLTFDEYKIQMQDQTVERGRRNYTAIPTDELIGNDDHEAAAELQWRIAIPLSIPILVMIAVPLSAVNPRQGKFGKMLPGLGLFFGYYILLVLAKSAVEDGKLPAHIGLWWIHLLGLVTAILLLIKERSTGGKIRHKVLNILHRKEG